MSKLENAGLAGGCLAMILGLALSAAPLLFVAWVAIKIMQHLGII